MAGRRAARTVGPWDRGTVETYRRTGITAILVPMPEIRIVSGGQTGVDRAALDTARALGLTLGGWCPRGRPAEDGVIPATYPLKETPTASYAERTEWNVRDSDGTLIVVRDEPTGGTAQTIEFARRLGRPLYLVIVDRPVNREGFRRWLEEKGIRTLNVAGPRESTDAGDLCGGEEGAGES